MAGHALVLLAAASWWSLEPLHAPKDATIDVLIARSGLDSVRPASKRELIRRVSFDLTGLPPSPVDVDSFINDSSAKAFENVVERLLTSPHFGERWARYWLDIARYSEDDVLGLVLQHRAQLHRHDQGARLHALQEVRRAPRPRPRRTR